VLAIWMGQNSLSVLVAIHNIANENGWLVHLCVELHCPKGCRCLQVGCRLDVQYHMQWTLPQAYNTHAYAVQGVGAEHWSQNF
jgi:hypothetical protein